MHRLKSTILSLNLYLFIREPPCNFEEETKEMKGQLTRGPEYLLFLYVIFLDMCFGLNIGQ